MTNAQGSATSNTAILNVTYAPTFTTNPQSRIILLGGSATLSLATDANPAATYIWYKNGSNAGTGSTYAITGATNASAASYYADATNSGGTVSSNTAKVSVVTSPVSTTVDDGDTASFSVSVAGTDSYSYQWQVSTNGGSSWSNLSGETGTGYSVTATPTHNGYKYRVISSITGDSVTSSVATLTVNSLAPGSVTISPTTPTVAAGGTASFSATVGTGTGPFSYSWEYSTNGGSSWSATPGSADASAYSFTTTKTDNGYRYRVQVTNAQGSTTSNTAILNVTYAPVATIPLHNRIIAVGETANLSFGVDANPSATISWTKNGLPVGTGTIHIAAASEADAGLYQAHADNLLGSIESTAAVISVIDTDLRVEAIDGTVATFEVRLSSPNIPEPLTFTYQWQKSTDGHNWLDITGEVSSSFSFTTDTPDDGTLYRALVSDGTAMGISNPISLSVNPSPPTGLVLEFANGNVIEGEEVRITVRNTLGTPPFTYLWEYSTDNGQTWKPVPSADLYAVKSSIKPLADLNEVLVFNSSHLLDGALYRVTVTNLEGSVTSEPQRLVVRYKPIVFSAGPSDLVITEGRGGEFVLAGEGNPTPSKSWLKDGQVVSNSGTYRIDAAKPADAGVYQGRLTNEIGSTDSSPTRFSVIGKLYGQAVSVGDKVVFNVLVYGGGNYSYQWQSRRDGSDWTDIVGASSSSYSFVASLNDNGVQYRVRVRAGSSEDYAVVEYDNGEEQVVEDLGSMKVSVTVTQASEGSGKRITEAYWVRPPPGRSWYGMWQSSSQASCNPNCLISDLTEETYYVNFRRNNGEALYAKITVNGRGEIESFVEIENPETLSDPNDPVVEIQTGELKKTTTVATRVELPKEVYAPWNGFLGNIVIAEIFNTGAETLDVTVNLHTMTGKQVRAAPNPYKYRIPPQEQRDIIINDIAGFTSDLYGVLKLSLSDNTYNGQVTYYKLVPGENFSLNDNEREQFDYVLTNPLTSPITGVSYVNYNTYQPSHVASEQTHLVPNWLTIINAEPSAAKYFLVKKYDESGKLVHPADTTGTVKELCSVVASGLRCKVPPLGRVDVDGGHVYPGPGHIGMLELIPEDANGKYSASLVRYGMGSEPTHYTDRYRFGVYLPTHTGTSAEQILALSTKHGAANYLEIGNTLSKQVMAKLKIYNGAGTQVLDKTYKIRAYAQLHLDPQEVLGADEDGVAILSATEQNALIASDLYYYRDETGRVQAVVSLDGEAARLSPAYGTYNLFLGMTNYLKVVNLDSTSRSLRVITHGKVDSSSGTKATDGTVEHQLPLQPRAISELLLSDSAQLKPNTLGMLSLSDEVPAGSTAFVFRFKPGAGGDIDFVVASKVR